MDNKKRKVGVIDYVFFILMAVFIFVVGSKIKSKSRLNEDFIKEIKFIQLNDIVVEINSDHNKSYNLLTNKNNIIYIDYVVEKRKQIEVGDSIVHNKSSDTVYLYRGSVLIHTKIFPELE